MNSPILIQTIVRGCPAYVVIDSVLNGTSSGGLRVNHDVNIEEVKALAREMTLKFNFIGLRRGGAKSGIAIGDVPRAEKLEIMTAFGRAIRPLIEKGLYYPGMDMNCGRDELAALYRGAGHEISKFTDSSFFTAVSVENAIQACFAGTESKVDVAIEGFGSVGAYLAARLPGDRFRIVAIATIRGAIYKEDGFCSRQLVASRREYGDDLVRHLDGCTAIRHEELHQLSVGLLVPAARTGAINAGNVGAIRAAYIVPAANAPYSEDVIDRLHERGIVCLPGFVTNSGGVYGSSLSDRGVSTARIQEISRTKYRGIVEALLSKSVELGRSPVRVAEAVARKRFAANLAADGHEPMAKKIYEKLRRRGLVPDFISAAAFYDSFSRNLDDVRSLVEGLSDVPG